MSRFVALDLPLQGATRTELYEALGRLSLVYELGDEEEVLLQPSLECAAQPVEIRIIGHIHGNIEQFGFAWAGSTVQLICSDIDRQVLEQKLIPRLCESIIAARVALHEGVEARVQNVAGLTRIILRERDGG